MLAGFYAIERLNSDAGTASKFRLRPAGSLPVAFDVPGQDGSHRGYRWPVTIRVSGRQLNHPLMVVKEHE